MIRIFNINELTAPWFALRAALGQRPYVLAVDPLFPPSSRALDRLVEWAVRTGRARWIIELVPDMRAIWDYHARILMYDIFAETEPWMNAYYGFEDAERTVPDYGMAYRQITCNFTRQRHFPYLLIEAALRAERPAGVKVNREYPGIRGIFKLRFAIGGIDLRMRSNARRISRWSDNSASIINTMIIHFENLRS